MQKRLVKIFSKHTFTEEELTADFYTELRISCDDLFATEEGIFGLDDFWSEKVRDILLGKVRI